MRGPWIYVTAMTLMIAGCGGGSTSPPNPAPEQLTFTPTAVAVPGVEPELDWRIAKSSTQYSLESDGDERYLVRNDHPGRHRIAKEWPAHSWLTLIDVTTATGGTRTYLHCVKASRILDHFEWSALYEMRGDEAVKIMPVAKMGFLQVRARNPMPSIYIDFKGDLYVLDPDYAINVVRDGRVIAKGSPAKLPLRDSGAAPRFLFLFSDGDTRILGVLKPMQNGISHEPTEADIDSKFKMEF